MAAFNFMIGISPFVIGIRLFMIGISTFMIAITGFVIAINYHYILSLQYNKIPILSLKKSNSNRKTAPKNPGGQVAVQSI